jgi:tRNA-specific 2-thiouridylase
VVCNQEIKFGLLAEKAKALGADYFATGHYAKIKQDRHSKAFYIERADDETKDQSYFLWAIPRESLPVILFPLGDYNKQEVVARVRKLELEVQSKESQDICFVSSGSSQDFLKRYIKSKSGIITDEEGNELGQHDGLFNYTVGQRHGLKITSPAPTYVLELDCSRNRLVVGKKEELQRDYFEIENAQWSVDQLEDLKDIKVKIRYGAKEIGCRIIGNLVKLAEPTLVITPGQSAVFYQKEKLIGGGIIIK